MREEYANLFHTLRELSNARDALLVAGAITEKDTSAQLKERVQLLFLDGHAQVGAAEFPTSTQQSQSAMDDVWETLFGPAIRLSSFASQDSVCFKQIVFPHPGPRYVLHCVKG